MMKRQLFTLLIICSFLTGCGGDAPSEDESIQPVAATDSIPTIEGEFIYLADAAVLKGKNFIYGVQMDSVSRKLADSIAPLKKDEFHMIPVVVKGKIVKNSGREGWEEVVQIREILHIAAESPDSAARKINRELDKP